MQGSCAAERLRGPQPLSSYSNPECFFQSSRIRTIFNMHRLFLSKEQLKQDHSPANILCANVMKFEWSWDSAPGQGIRLLNWRRILCYRLLGNTDKNLSLASFAQLQSPVLPVCENTGGVCSTTNLAVEDLYLFYNFSHGDNVVTLWILEQQKSQLLSVALAFFPSSLHQVP